MGACSNADCGGGDGGVDLTGAVRAHGDVACIAIINPGAQGVAGCKDGTVFGADKVARDGHPDGDAGIASSQACPDGDGGGLDIGEDAGDLVGGDTERATGLDGSGGIAEICLGGGADPVERHGSGDRDGV